jgi:hypothetical protein
MDYMPWSSAPTLLLLYRTARRYAGGLLVSCGAVHQGDATRMQCMSAAAYMDARPAPGDHSPGLSVRCSLQLSSFGACISLPSDPCQRLASAPSAPSASCVDRSPARKGDETSAALPPRRNTVQSLSRTDVANANCCLSRSRLPRGRNMSARLADWGALPCPIDIRARTEESYIPTAIARLPLCVPQIHTCSPPPPPCDLFLLSTAPLAA